MARPKTPKRSQRGTKHRLIYDLGTDYVERIDAMLVKGTSGDRLAAKMQQEWGVHQDVKAATLSKALIRYKKDVLAGRMVTTVERKDEEGTVVERTEYRPNEPRIDAHECLTELVLTQQERLNKLYAREKSMPTLMDQMRKEIHACGQLLKQLADLQLELGLLKRAPKKVQLDGYIDLGDFGGQERYERGIQEQQALHAATQEALDALLGEDVQDGEFEDIGLPE